MSIACVSWFLTWVAEGGPRSSDKVTSWVSGDFISAIVEAKSDREAWDLVDKAGNVVAERRSTDGHSYMWTPETSLTVEGT